MEGYTKLIYNFDEFLYKLNLWIEENNLTKEDAASKLGISRGLFRFWFINCCVISISTYNKIKDNLKNITYYKKYRSICSYHLIHNIY